MKRFYTSESVTAGHPDKLCDQISDAILDTVLLSDPYARVACEVAIKHNLVVIMGEITTTAQISKKGFIDTAKDVIRDAGYTGRNLGFDLQGAEYRIEVNEQAPDIKSAIDREAMGAGDQGIMIGYATNETPQMMPLPIVLANRLSKKLDDVRKQDRSDFFRPDGKTQVTVAYEDGIPLYVDSVVISIQHREGVEQGELEEFVIDQVVRSAIPDKYLRQYETKYYINPGGRFVMGGPEADCGLTGRKIMVDTYGGRVRHGGGAFSGKDLTKVDRSGAYMARYAAKNLVAAGLVDRCEIELAYAIGIARPIKVQVDSMGTGELPDDVISHLLVNTLDFRPEQMIKKMSLVEPNYKSTAIYGHFGWEASIYPWERTDMANVLALKAKPLIMPIGQWFMYLNPDNIGCLSKQEFFGYVMERPGHPGTYGFLIPGALVLEHPYGNEVMVKLMKMLGRYPVEEVKRAVDEHRERVRMMREL